MFIVELYFWSVLDKTMHQEVMIEEIIEEEVSYRRVRIVYWRNLCIRKDSNTQ